jgi:phosphoribosyl 1,2-cyclic phosphodiesterase
MANFLATKQTLPDSTTQENPGNRSGRPGDCMQICVLASGSKGNAIYVSDGQTAILIDAGLSGKQIAARMHSRGLAPEKIDAILVTHEHSDHIQGVGVLSRRFDLPVYLTPDTARAAAPQVGRLTQRHFFTCGEGFRINGLEVHPFSISHDAIDPAGFTIRGNGTKLGIATDLGIATAVVREHLRDCSLLIIEANHDPEMLINGPYPWPLKQRIQSRTGHLSNFDSRILIEELLHPDLAHVVLAHLSEQNNSPQMALDVVTQGLTASRTQFHVAVQNRCTELIFL